MITVAQTKGNDTLSGDLTIVWDNNTTTGNLIVVLASVGTSENITAINDTDLNTYTKIEDIDQNTTTMQLWYAYNIVGGTTPTITLSVTGGDSYAIAREFSGNFTTDPLDVSISAGYVSNDACFTGYEVTNYANFVEVVYAVTSGTALSFNSSYINNSSHLTAIDDLYMANKFYQVKDTIGTTTSNGISTTLVGATAFKEDNQASKNTKHNKLRPAIFAPGRAR